MERGYYFLYPDILDKPLQAGVSSAIQVALITYGISLLSKEVLERTLVEEIHVIALSYDGFTYPAIGARFITYDDNLSQELEDHTDNTFNVALLNEKMGDFIEFISTHNAEIEENLARYKAKAPREEDDKKF